MLRKVVCAAFILVLSVGVVMAEEFRALITKVDGDKVTFYPFEGKGKDAKKGEEKTMKVAKDVKITRGKDAEEVEGGLKHKMFTDISEKGIFARITTDDDNKRIKEIRVRGKKK